MPELAKDIIPINIEKELKQSYLDYALSVIVARALPDVRDGLKPVHRRSLYAMDELSNYYNKPHKKSARVVGDVIGKYHPHGDSAVYNTIVRMAQPFSMRYLLVDGQGNFGSVDGDAPAAMRYTEIRLTKFAQSMLDDLDKETVAFAPNYDGSEQIPEVLPAHVPNLLVNGTSGIAVGMATNIPPHNLTEVINGTLALLDDPEITIAGLMEYITGPDFPTAGFINGRSGIALAYATGRGKIYMRARYIIEEAENGKASIIVTELPYQVNKAMLLEKIGMLVRDKSIEGITALRDESDKHGMRMVIEVRRGDQPEIIVNNLFTQTQMQCVFGINLLALSHGQPKLFNLKQMLEAFLAHRRDVVTKRSIYELRKAREKAHILEGLGISLANIDEMISLIKASKTPVEAKDAMLARPWISGEVASLLAVADVSITRPDDLADGYGLLHDGYYLSPDQAQAILDLRLHKLTGLEKEKIYNEYKELTDQIIALLKILSEPDELHRVIREELERARDEFGDERRTEILDVQDELTHEDLIEPEDVVVTLSHDGYVKTQALDTYAAQHRGGRGKAAASMKDSDVITKLLLANTHDNILCFSSIGKVYWLKVYHIPKGSRQSLGRPLVNLLPLATGEVITEILPVHEFDEKRFVFMVTRLGKVKKVSLADFSRPRSNGIIALDLIDGDTLIGAAITVGDNDIMLISSAGKAIRFHEAAVRAMGRTAAGMRGMSLDSNQEIISLLIVDPEATLLTATANGYGQRTSMSDYRISGRGGKGVIAIQVSSRNGAVIGAAQVNQNHEALLISNKGTMVRIPMNEVSVIGRNTQGVRLINLGSDEKLVALESVLEDDNTVHSPSE
jgi:DNA gyrase subunit A